MLQLAIYKEAFMILKVSTIFTLFLLFRLEAVRPMHGTALTLTQYSSIRINNAQPRPHSPQLSSSCIKLASAISTGTLGCIASGVLFSTLLPIPASVLLAFAIGIGSASSTYVGLEALEECKRKRQEDGLNL